MYEWDLCKWGRDQNTWMHANSAFVAYRILPLLNQAFLYEFFYTNGESSTQALRKFCTRKGGKTKNETISTEGVQKLVKHCSIIFPCSLYFIRSFICIYLPYCDKCPLSVILESAILSSSHSLNPQYFTPFTVF